MHLLRRCFSAVYDFTPRSHSLESSHLIRLAHTNQRRGQYRRLPVMCSSKLSQGELSQALVDSYIGRFTTPLIDIGANLADPSFDQDREAVIGRAKEANVGAILITGSSIESTRRAADICSTSGGRVFFTAGVHPHAAKSCNEQTLMDLRAFAQNPRCVAIGECGLDFNRNFSPPAVQEQWFEEQVKLAVELQKPLFLHSRDASERFMRILQRHKLTAPAVAHCFTGSRSDLEAYLSLGLHIGITGWVCDDRPERAGTELAKLLPMIPKDRLMIETDAPYLVPRNIKPAKARPRRNEPALLPSVLLAVADALCEDPESVSQRTTANAIDFFNLPITL